VAKSHLITFCHFSIPILEMKPEALAALRQALTTRLKSISITDESRYITITETHSKQAEEFLIGSHKEKFYIRVWF
jgi:hypothetical protein